MDEKTAEKLIELIKRHTDIQIKFAELMQGQKQQNERFDRLIDSLNKLIEQIDNYPLRTLERIDEVRDKIGGETGLRVQVRRQHDELKVIIRNWQIFAAALITVFSVIIKIVVE